MAESIINTGDKIEIYKAGGDPSKDKRYVSRLIDLLDGNKANILMPIDAGKIILLPVGVRYDICFFTKNGMYQCKALIVDRFKSENIYMLTVQFLTGLEKFQRRQYFRLSCIMDVYYRAFSEEEQKLMDALKNEQYRSVEERDLWKKALEENAERMNQGTINNLSAGGIRFGSKHCFEKDSTIIVRFDISENGVPKELEFKARVISSERSTNPNYHYETRVEFQDVDSKTREMLVKYIFNEERKQRQRS